MQKTKFKMSFFFSIAAALCVSLFSCSHQQTVSPSLNGYAALNYSLLVSINNFKPYTLNSMASLIEKNEVNPIRARKWYYKANESMMLSGKILSELQEINESLAESAGG